jgi:hypothetical protein
MNMNLTETNGLGYDLRWKDHRNEVFAALHRLRSNSALSDVSVFCSGGSSATSSGGNNNNGGGGGGGELFRAHKVVLASCSVVFEHLLTSSSSGCGDKSANNTVLVMTDVSSNMFNHVLNFMYDGEVFLKVDEMEEFMRVAKRLGVRGLLHEAPAEADPQNAGTSDGEAVKVVPRASRAWKRPSNPEPISDPAPAKRASKRSRVSSSPLAQAGASAALSIKANRAAPTSSRVEHSGNVATSRNIRVARADEAARESNEGGGEENVSITSLDISIVRFRHDHSVHTR